MHIIKSSFLIISFFFYSVSYSQNIRDYKYIDIDLNEINFSEYTKKCKSFLYSCIDFNTDNLTVNKIYSRYVFGKISKNEYSQIRKLLIKDTETQIAPNDIIIVKYSDSLTNIDLAYKKYLDHIKMHNTFFSSLSLNERKQQRIKKKYVKRTLNDFKSERKKWSDRKKKCVKKIEKKHNTKVTFIYRIDKNPKDTYNGLNWTKDRGVFKNKFFKNIYNGYLLILKPDGEYFLSGGHLEDDQYHLLIKNLDWTQFKIDLQETIHNYPLTGKGFFNTENLIHFHDKQHCFYK